MSVAASDGEHNQVRSITIVGLRCDLRAAIRSGRTTAASRIADQILDMQEAARREERSPHLGPFPGP